jgi:hypothetical protein
MSPDDLIETRTGQTTQRMRWPLDAETTAKLQRACAVTLVMEPPLTVRQRLIRLLTKMKTPASENQT